MMFDPGSFARRLDFAMQERRIGKTPALAATLGVDEGALERWRRGEAISLDDLMRLSGHLRVSIDWLLTGSGRMNAVNPEVEDFDCSTLAADMAALDPDLRERLADLTRHLVDARRESLDAADTAGREVGRIGTRSIRRRTDC